MNISIPSFNDKFSLDVLGSRTKEISSHEQTKKKKKKITTINTKILLLKRDVYQKKILINCKLTLSLHLRPYFVTALPHPAGHIDSKAWKAR